MVQSDVPVAKFLGSQILQFTTSLTEKFFKFTARQGCEN